MAHPWILLAQNWIVTLNIVFGHVLITYCIGRLPYYVRHSHSGLWSFLPLTRGYREPRSQFSSVLYCIVFRETWQHFTGKSFLIEAIRAAILFLFLAGCLIGDWSLFFSYSSVNTNRQIVDYTDSRKNFSSSESQLARCCLLANISECLPLIFPLCW